MTTPTPATPERRSRGWAVVGVLLLIALVGSLAYYTGAWEKSRNWLALLTSTTTVQTADGQVLISKETITRVVDERVTPRLDAAQADIQSLNERLEVQESKPAPAQVDYQPQIDQLAQDVKTLGERFDNLPPPVDYQPQIDVLTGADRERARQLAALEAEVGKFATLDQVQAGNRLLQGQIDELKAHSNTPTESNLPVEEFPASGYSPADVAMMCDGLDVEFSTPIEEMTQEQLLAACRFCESLRKQELPPIQTADEPHLSTEEWSDEDEAELEALLAKFEHSN